MADLELLSIGLINDMYCESRNDSFSYAVLADQAAYDAFWLKNSLFLLWLVVEKGCKYDLQPKFRKKL